jgi:hypothetical protein
MGSEKQEPFAPWKAFFDAAPPRSNPASRVFRYPHSFFPMVHTLNLLTVGFLPAQAGFFPIHSGLFPALGPPAYLNLPAIIHI